VPPVLSLALTTFVIAALNPVAEPALALEELLLLPPLPPQAASVSDASATALAISVARRVFDIRLFHLLLMVGPPA
jgi:hypothetical protein